MAFSAPRTLDAAWALKRLIQALSGGWLSLKWMQTRASGPPRRSSVRSLIRWIVSMIISAATTPERHARWKPLTVGGLNSGHGHRSTQWPACPELVGAI